jgi:hypothetical protein
MIAFSKRLRAAAVFAGAASSCVAACIALAQAPGQFTPAPGPLSAIQPPATGAAVPADPNASRWRPPSATQTGASASATARVTPASGTDTGLRPIASVPRTPIAKVTNGSGTLPNDHGQIWREYDITPYTLRVTSTNRPEQAIVDWVLRETGYEAWHSDPVGLLSADHRTLRVYHTPEMQAVVSEMVDRFVNSQAETQAFGLHIMSIGTPSWRAKAQRILHPVAVQSQGIQAWMLAKEDAAMLVADMHKRGDFREYNSPYLLVNNGQATTVNTMQTRSYTNGIELHPEMAHPGFVPQQGHFDEGFSLQFSPLLSIDGKSIDAMFKCNLDQIERLTPVSIDVPTAIAPRQHTEIEVPQWCSYRLHERFHWPVDQVLLISFGVVATPVNVDSGIKIPLMAAAPPRAELLVMAECRGANGKAPSIPPRTGQRDAQNYLGRY